MQERLTSGGRALRIHPDDLGKFDLLQGGLGARSALDPNAGRMSSKEMWRKLGIPVKVDEGAPRLDALAHNFNEEMGWGQGESRGVAGAEGKSAYDLRDVDPEYGVNADDLVQAFVNRERTKKARGEARRRAEEGENEEEYFRKLYGVEEGEKPLYQAETAGLPKDPYQHAVEYARKEWAEKGTGSRLFKRWFGKSKVVDDSGEPRVMYAGPLEGGLPIFHEEPKGAGAHALEVYVKAEKVFDYGETEHQQALAFLLKREPGFEPWWLEEAKSGSREMLEKPMVQRYINGHHFDGYYVGEGGARSLVVFDPRNVKSTGNRGTFEGESPDILHQEETPASVKGSFQLDGERAIITLFRGKADFSTWMHEYGHYLRRASLVGEDEKKVAAWLRSEGHAVDLAAQKWSTGAEERFARAFERYLRDGAVPSEALRSAFRKIAAFMRDVYKKIRGTELAKGVPEDIRRVFDRLMRDPEGRGGAQGDKGRLYQESEGFMAEDGRRRASPKEIIQKAETEDPEFGKLPKSRITYEYREGGQRSGVLSFEEEAYTQVFNEAYPIEKVQKVYEKMTGAKVSEHEDLRLAVSKVLGAGGTADELLRRRLAPIYRGGEVDGVQYEKLTNDEQRQADNYALARNVLERIKLNQKYRPNVMDQAQAAKYKRFVEENLSPALSRKIIHAADGLVRYGKELAARKVAAGIWTPAEYQDFVTNRYYIPEIRAFQETVSTPLGKVRKQRFTSRNQLIRGTFGEEVDAPDFDPVTALVHDTRELENEAAKMAVTNRMLELALKEPELAKWFRRKLDKERDFAGTAEGEFFVLRTGKEELTPAQREFAEKYRRAKWDMENLGRADDPEMMRRRERDQDLRRRMRNSKGATEPEKEKFERFLDERARAEAAYETRRRTESQAVLEQFKKLPLREKDLIETWIDEGRVQTWIAPREIAEAINGMQLVELAFWHKWFMVPVASFFRKMQVAWNPAFTLSNVARDLQEAFYNVGMHPGWALKGLWHYLNKDGVYYEFLRHGGSMGGDKAGLKPSADMGRAIRYGGGFFDRYNKALDAAAWQEKKIVAFGTEVDVGTAARIWELTRKTLDIPLDMFEAIGEAGEMMTRLGVFEFGQSEKGLSKDQAARLARQATLDFRRMGAKMKTPNALIPFLNARLQGIDRLVRTAKDEPAAAAARLAVAGLAPATALLAWNLRNEHYAEIPTWEKEYYWIIMRGKDTRHYWKIAKGHVAQLAVNPFQMYFEGLLGTAKKASVVDFFANAARAGLPVDDAGGLLTPVVKAPLEQKAGEGGWDFYFGRPIVSDPRRARVDQYNPGTFEVVKSLGKALNLSPERLQHLARALAGGGATNALFVADKVLGAVGAVPDKKTEAGYVPVLNKFLGKTEEYKSDFEHMERALMREIKDKSEGLGMRGVSGRIDPRRSAFANQLRQAIEKKAGVDELGKVNEGLRNSQRELSELHKALATLRKEKAANNELRKKIKDAMDPMWKAVGL